MVSSRFSRILRCLDVAAAISLCGTVLLLLPCVLRSSYWWAELIVHWHPWLLGALVVQVPWMIWRRRWKSTLVGLLLLTHGVWLLWPWLSPGEGAWADGSIPDSAELCVVTINAHANLADHEALVNWALQYEPHLIVIQEVMPVNAEILHRRLKDRYAHFHVADQSAPFTTVLASRIPVLDSKVLKPNGPGSSQLMARVKTAKGPATILAVHLSPPVYRESTDNNRSELSMLARFAMDAQGRGEALIVAGDFNLTPWSPTFESFIRSTKLRDPRRQHGLHATWTPGGVLPVAFLPIDHILASGAWHVTSLHRGPLHGSDHRPFLATLSRRTPSKK